MKTIHKFVIGLVLVGLFLGAVAWVAGRLPTHPEKTEAPSAVVPSPTRTPPTGLMFVTLSSGSVKKGEKVRALVNFYAENKTIFGSDAVISYDPNILKADEKIEDGDYFKLSPQKRVDNEAGMVRFTGFDPKDAKPMGEMHTLCVVTFTALASGESPVTLEFEPWKTNLSTIVEKGTSQNILGSVKSASLTVKP